MSLLFLSCNANQNDPIVLKGDVKNIPGNMIYLTDAYKFDILLDSTKVVNNAFELTLPNGYPKFLARLTYKTSSGKFRSLIYFNNVLSKGTAIYSTSAFMLETGVTRFSGELLKPDGMSDDNLIKVIQGKQTNTYFKFQMDHFGINSSSIEDRMKSFERIKKIVEEHKYSTYIALSIFNNKESYSIEELKELAALFSDEVKHEQVFANLIKSIEYRSTIKEKIHSTVLETTNGTSKLMMSEPAKLNMIIFWASWCGPCRREIPELKTLYNEYNSDKRVKFISVSINENKDQWKQALNVEGMPWEQLLIPKSDQLKIRSQFNFSEIPLTIIIDDKGNIIKRVSGFTEGNIGIFRQFINKYLGTNKGAN